MTVYLPIIVKVMTGPEITCQELPKLKNKYPFGWSSKICSGYTYYSHSYSQGIITNDMSLPFENLINQTNVVPPNDRKLNIVYFND